MSETKTYKVGDTVKGTVYNAKADAIYLEIEEGVKAVLYAHDYAGADNNPKWFEDLMEGSDFEAQVKQIGKDKRDENVVVLVLSTKLEAEAAEREKRAAQLEQKIAAIKAIKDSDEIINAKVDRIVKNGVELRYNNTKLYLPYKQTELTEEDFKKMKGQEIPVLVVYLNEETHSVAVSHIAALRKQKRLERVAALDAINVGDVMEGTVVSLMQYGAIVNLGVVSGLLHISEIDYFPVKEIAKVLHVGDKIQVKVIKKNEDKIGLSMKALKEHPWDVLKSQFKVGDVVELPVLKFIPAGIILEVTKEYSGLMPAAEYSWNVTEKYDGVVKEGDLLKVKIMNIDDAKHRISLSHRALEVNAWADVKLHRGDKIEVKIAEIKDRGAEVEYLGVVGFLPISEVSAEKRVASVSEIYPVGSVVTVAVTDCDPQRAKLVVSVKEIELAKERETFEKYQDDEPAGQTLGDLINFDDLKDEDK